MKIRWTLLQAPWLSCFINALSSRSVHRVHWAYTTLHLKKIPTFWYSLLGLRSFSLELAIFHHVHLLLINIFLTFTYCLDQTFLLFENCAKINYEVFSVLFLLILFPFVLLLIRAEYHALEENISHILLA